MSMSLRDQLLKAGLVTEKQAREAERQQGQQERQKQKQQPKERRNGVSDSELAARQAQQAKAARDQELNRRQKEQADAKARHAQVDQLVEQNKVPKPQTDERYNFVAGRKIRRIPADAAVRDRITRGELAIVRCSTGYELVTAETAGRIRERDERAVVVWMKDVKDAPKPADDGYAGYEVPDDLMW